MKYLLILTLSLFTINAFSQSETTWNYATPIASPIVNTTPVAIKAAAGVSAKNYLTGLQVYNTSATVSSIVTIQNGSTVVWTGYVPAMTAALPLVPVNVVFQAPVKSGLNTALNVVVNTTGASVFVSAQGYTGK